MRKINLVTLSLSVSLSILCSSFSTFAMDVLVEKENLSGDLHLKKQSTFIELMEEKMVNQKKIVELYNQPATDTFDMSALMDLLMFEGDKSSLEFEALKTKCMEASQKKDETPQQIELINKRDAEINKQLPQALVEWQRQRMTKISTTDESYNSSGKPFLGERVMIGNHHIISVPECLQTKASQSVYTKFDPRTGLHYRMELLTDQNINWYRERMGLEALMAFWNPMVKEIEEKLPWLADTFNDTPVETRVQQAFDPEPFDFRNFSAFKHLSFYELMATGTQNFDRLPLSFQEACQNHNLSETQLPDILGALRGFELNLRSYKSVPTWIALSSSQKIDNIQDIDPTSSIIKIFYY